MSTSLKNALVMARAMLIMAALFAATPSARGEEIRQRSIGVGYKLGNGIGFTGGDVIVRPLPHVVFDLQASYASRKELSGYAVAPTVGVQLKSVGHTPYLNVGLVHLRMSNEWFSGYSTGFVANAGYEWRFASGVGVLLGGGVQQHGPVHVTKGDLPDGKWSSPFFNIEAGLRYFF